MRVIAAMVNDFWVSTLVLRGIDTSVHNRLQGDDVFVRRLNHMRVAATDLSRWTPYVPVGQQQELKDRTVRLMETVLLVEECASTGTGPDDDPMDESK